MAQIVLSDLYKGNYPISQAFGVNKDYYKQFTLYGIPLEGHEGVDFVTPIGIPVLAPFNGKIIRVGLQSDYKNYGLVNCIWDPVQQFAIWLAHLNTVSTQLNQSVSKGQIIGTTGNSGNTTGPHLHAGGVFTDKYGNRLNIRNGYGGFVNIMDPSIIQWNLAPHSPADQAHTILFGPDSDSEKIAKLKVLFP